MSSIGVVGVGGLPREAWDVVVIGAGPGGGLAAGLLAGRGRSVLLIEKSVFPRWKVCGACLGASGVGVLERAGLREMLDATGARRVERVELLWRGRRASAGLAEMVAVSRGALDTGLARAALDAGAEVRFGVRAEADANGRVQLVGEDGEAVVRAKAVVGGGGLRSIRGGVDGGAREGAWIGLGVAAPCDDDFAADRSLSMIVGERGYVGRIRTEDGRANWAAAVDPGLVRARGSAGAAIASLCEGNAAGWSPPPAGWLGTPALTRRADAVEGVVCRVGDASGYVEPITGEGMSWALLGAEALAPVVDRAIAEGRSPAAWAGVHGRLMRGRRVRCAAVARGLRSAVAMRAAMMLIGGAEKRGSHRIVDGLVGGLIGGRA